MSQKSQNSLVKQDPPAETVANLSKDTYHQRVTALAERIHPRLADETGTLETVDYDKVLGHLRVIERISHDNPFSILEHTTYSLSEYDQHRVQGKRPINGLVEQTRRLLAGDVQKRLLELSKGGKTDIHNEDRQRGRRR
ncbi:hypothetical protein [Halococcus salifodinae]|jgi:hypothetical protein|uniref:Uncharacterized protein n=1 Tax=Halococcus salifodinae DSM 8989 TaxID=1227456 RepID=M0NAI4_9EURY|nr:hypothetical protein [Halococcus salifodinae]EMA54568.1 hypothetical protein C450_05915 [Halococcus salifodinae DSM 8989]